MTDSIEAYLRLSVLAPLTVTIGHLYLMVCIEPSPGDTVDDDLGSVLRTGRNSVVRGVACVISTACPPVVLSRAGKPNASSINL